MSIHNWEPGFVEQQARRDNVPLKVIYVHNHLCPVCHSARTSATHRNMNGKCAKIMKQRRDNEKETT